MAGGGAGGGLGGGESVCGLGEVLGGGGVDAAAREDVTAAQAGLTEAITDAAARARRPGSGGTATVDPTVTERLTEAEDRLTAAQATSRATASHLPLAQVRPGSRLLETERKLLTHAIRMSAYNTESALARLLRPHYARGQDEARALLREAFTLTGDLHITGDTLHVRLDPATAPRRSRALAALCADLTAHPNPLPRHRPDPRLQRQKPPNRRMIQLTMSGVLGFNSRCDLFAGRRVLERFTHDLAGSIGTDPPMQVQQLIYGCTRHPGGSRLPGQLVGQQGSIEAVRRHHSAFGMHLHHRLPESPSTASD